MSDCVRYGVAALVAAAMILSPVMADAQKTKPLTVQMADEAIARWPEGASKQWDFTLGIELAGINAAWQKTQNKAYLDYIQRTIDRFVQPDGSILTYKRDDYALNDMLLGRQLVLLYDKTKEAKYKTAMQTLRAQLKTQPRTASGGFWHAQATPTLMMLDDQYMLDPFLAEYAVTFKEPEDFREITKQFSLLDIHARDPRTNLLYHGWDEGRSAAWANPKTGASPNLWARGMGWYLMALADSLPYYDPKDPGRDAVERIFVKTATALVAKQDAQTGLWYQLLDKPELKENYIESSSCVMITYALAKGARLGYLPREDGAAAARAWTAIQQRFVKTAADGSVSLTGTVTGVALGAAPANDGSDGYYLHAPVVSDDPKGIGPLLMLSAEMERKK